MKPIKRSKAITYDDDDHDDNDDDDESLEQKKETYNKILDEKLDEIQELSRETDYKTLQQNLALQ